MLKDRISTLNTQTFIAYEVIQPVTVQIAKLNSTKRRAGKKH